MTFSAIKNRPEDQDGVSKEKRESYFATTVKLFGYCIALEQDGRDQCDDCG
jgi:hypothetical protein